MIFEEQFYIILATLTSMAVTFIAMPLLLRFCKSKGYYDLPGGRKVHTCAVPRLGGLLFMPAMLIGFSTTLVFYFNGAQGQGALTLKISSIILAIGAFLIYTIGTVDDLAGMKANNKFFIQLLAALLMPFCGLMINNFYGLFGLHALPIWFSYPFTVFVILLIVNSINLIDGIDGLASGLCICILAIYILLYQQMQNTYIYAAGTASLLGSLIAFFCYNMWGNAEKGTKVFMGDSGSLFLGYALAYLSIKYATDNQAVLPYRSNALLISYTLVIIPTFDVIRVALFRLFRRKPIFEADKTHIHHLVMAAGFTMRQALIIILCLFAVITVFNFYVLFNNVLTNAWIVIIDVALYILFITYCLNKASQRKLAKS